MNQRFIVLDSFRGMFAILIVIYHMDIVGSFIELSFFNRSSIFVEFFFVLSGFVLSHGYSKKDDLNFRKFIISRTFRLFPLHITMLAVFLVLELGKYIAFQKGFAFNNEPFTGGKAVSEILPNLFLLQSWSPHTTLLTFNHPSWSISIEYYMYMFFFCTLIIFRQYKLTAWIVISALTIYAMLSNSTLLQSEVERGLSCFFAGCITYAVYDRLKGLVFNYNVSSLIELSLVASVIVSVSYEFEYRWLVLTLLFCLSIFIFSFESGIISSMLKWGFFTKIGELSYSIYMVHAAILYIVLSLMMVAQKITGQTLTPTIEDKTFLTLGSDVANNALVFVILLVVIAFSFITHKYIEIPGNNLGKKLLHKKIETTSVQLQS